MNERKMVYQRYQAAFSAAISILEQAPYNGMLAENCPLVFRDSPEAFDDFAETFKAITKAVKGSAKTIEALGKIGSQET